MNCAVFTCLILHFATKAQYLDREMLLVMASIHISIYIYNFIIINMYIHIAAVGRKRGLHYLVVW